MNIGALSKCYLFKLVDYILYQYIFIIIKSLSKRTQYESKRIIYPLTRRLMQYRYILCRICLLLKVLVKISLGALLTLVFEYSEQLHAGVQVQIIGGDMLENELFPYSFRHEVYLTELVARNWLRVTLQEQSREFIVLFPETTELLPFLGTYSCICEVP